MKNRILSEKEVLQLIPKSRSTLWRWEKAGLFPRRRKYGARSCGWLETEIQEFISNFCIPSKM